MNVQDEDKPYDDINITPMLDLAYVLLVIFIIMTTASVQGIKVDLPKASASTSLAKPKTKAITINSQGEVFLDAYPVTMADLETQLRTEKATTPDFPIVVKGDATVQYQKVMDVLDLLRRLDLNQVGLVTGRPTPGAG
jgi:biopolymer transport protein ExbD